jgi:hypothetical protein
MLRALLSPSSNRACSARRRFRLRPFVKRVAAAFVEDVVRHTDGASCGFANPRRRFGERFSVAAE